MKNSKCPNCGGFYEFCPESQALKCTNCGGLKEIDNEGEIISHDFNDVKANENWSNDIEQVKCTNCGANVLMSRYAIINKCSYCGSSALTKSENKAGIAPDAVLPFQFGVEKAKENFRNGVRKKLFVPNVLRKQTPELHVAPRYVSSYRFKGDLEANYNGTIEIDKERRNSKGETESYTERKQVSGVISHNFDYIVEASTNLSQYEFDKILPYNLDLAKPYKEEYLLGSSAEYSDKSLSDANNELEGVIKSDVNRSILRKYNADRVVSMSLTLNYQSKKLEYMLLPTYIFNYDFKKKNYKTIMNGQTGKLGGGIPRSKVKITFFVLAIILVVFGIVGLIMLSN